MRALFQKEYNKETSWVIQVQIRKLPKTRSKINHKQMLQAILTPPFQANNFFFFLNLIEIFLFKANVCVFFQALEALKKIKGIYMLL